MGPSDLYMGGVHRLDFACISGLIVSMLMIGQGATAYNSCTLLGYCTVRPFLECVNLAPGSLEPLILNISKKITIKENLKNMYKQGIMYTSLVQSLNSKNIVKK
jgi:hypothetical protein